MSRLDLSQPPAAPLIGASILGADFSRLGDDCRAALAAGADGLHLDVMDGHFVPNLTMGPAICRSLRKTMPGVFLDVHLMVSDPAAFVAPFATAGADLFVFHIEAVPQPEPLLSAIRGAGMAAGLAINPPTPVDSLLPHLDLVDLVLIMSVNPGFAGQSFIPQVLEKVRRVRPRLLSGQRLQIDGGVGPDNAAACIEAGCDFLVAASAIFRAPDYHAAIEAMRRPQALANH